MTLDLHLKIVGAIMFAIILLNFHVWKRYGWRRELQQVSLLTRQVFVVHTFFIMLMIGMFGALSLVFTAALLERTPLAKLVLTGLVLFWASRLAMQWLVYDASLWRGKRAETIVHFVFTGVWVYFTVVYGAALWRQWEGVGGGG